MNASLIKRIIFWAFLFGFLGFLMAGKTANLAAEILSIAVAVMLFSLLGAGVGFGLYLLSKKK